ncbi:LysR family transcriptional regulator [Mesorhizobium erdmanii]|uniref:LysR family transcriptional regulator n=2 Tax=Mesorhizobium TaxID=68287 RepID=A0A3M9XEB7_9HYPH|nr:MULTISPECIES: LysR family transcriptional regulator [Mesorhizobium]RNJ46241.1 LysR family transcriptional regulator [Mesorhizobium japonicum]RXT47562.1 LysR family transcriptional regulator [Mesorhizobium erdmanii]
MDRLASMTAFVKAAESGSFAATASALGISPQMVAKHVTYLEARLGARLLNRTTRKQSLTVIGKSYYDRCKVALAEVDWADAIADEARGKPRGLLRVNAPVSFGAHCVTPVVARYLSSHPSVDVDLVLNDRFVDLIDDGFEAVFRIGPLGESNLGAVELAPFQTIACGSPAYLKERGMPSIVSDLVDHECLLFGNWPEPTFSDWLFVRDGLTSKASVHGRLKVNNPASLLEAALAGFGLALIGEEAVRTHLATGRLVRVLPNYETPPRPIHLLFHPDRRQTPKLKTFIEMVVDQLGRNGQDGHRRQQGE